MSTTTSKDHPFPGLRPFEYADREYFFGRNEQIAELYQKLVRNRFVAVVGASGSGKSSLVKAGLFGRVDDLNSAGGASRWRRILLRPQRDPLRQLAAAVSDEQKRQAREAAGHSGDEALNYHVAIGRADAWLRRSSLGLTELLDEIERDEQTRFLVVVDQFEELFRFHPAIAPLEFDERSLFVKHLLAASQAERRPYHVLLTMRSEFLGECTQFLGLPEAINDSQFLTPRLTREQRSEAITGPIALAGGRLSPTLLQRLLNDTGSEPDQLPVMQHALMRTWEQALPDRELRMEHYERAGEMGLAISNHANQAFESFATGLWPLIERIFRSLTERDTKGRDVRRPIAFTQLTSETGAPEAEVRQVLETFRAPECAFVLPAAGTPIEAGTIIDISHEALIRKWDKLRTWVQSEAEDGQTYQRLSHLAEEFQRDPRLRLGTSEALDRQKWWLKTMPNAARMERYGGRFEFVKQLLDSSITAARRDKFRRVALPLGILSFVVATGAVMLAMFAMDQRHVAEVQRSLAEENARRAMEQRASAERAREDEARQRAFAEVAREDAQRQRELAEKAREDEKRQRTIAEDALAEAQRGRAEIEKTVIELKGLVESTGAEKTQFQLQARAIQTRLLAAQAREALQKKNYAGAIKAALEAITEGSNSESPSQEAADATEVLKAAIREAPLISSWSGAQGGPFDVGLQVAGRRAAVVMKEHGEIGLWSPVADVPITGPDMKVPGISATLSPEGSRLATYRYLINDGTTQTGSAIRVFDASGPTELAAWTMPEVPVGAGPVNISWSPDGKLIAVAVGTDSAKILDAETGDEVRTIKMPEAGPADGALLTLNSVVFSPDSKTVLAVGRLLSTVRIFDVAVGHLLVTLRGHVLRRGLIRCAAFSPDGRRIVTGGLDNNAIIWDSRRESPLFTLTHSNAVMFAQFSPSGEKVLTAASAKEVRIWDVKTGALLLTLQPDDDSIKAAQFTEDGNTIFVATGAGRAYLWNSLTGTLVWSLNNSGERLVAATMLPDARRVITVSEGGVVRHWRTDLDTQRPLDPSDMQELKDRARELLKLYDLK